MLYGEECVSAFLKCEMCQANFKEAKILLCGLFCFNCVAELTKNSNKVTEEFKCEFCHDIQQIPKNGFKSWKALSQFYSNELSLEDIYRGETVEKLKLHLNLIRKQIDSFDFYLANSVDCVKEHCLKLRNAISLEAQVRVKRIQEVEDELIQEVLEYENKCFQNELKKCDIDQFVKEMKDFHQEWSEYLKKYQINDAEMALANESASDLKSRFKKEMINFFEKAFNKRLMKFMKSEKNIDKEFLGNFCYDPFEEIVDFKILLN